MKILFLDIDGVLNSDLYYRSVDRTKRNWNRFDPSTVVLVKKLIEEFSLKVVITSTWRFGAVKMLNDELVKSGLSNHLHAHWKTPNIHPPHRGTEIELWLDNHPDVNDYVIIDDDISILDEQKSKYVKTELIVGMNEIHYSKVKDILSSIITK